MTERPDPAAPSSTTADPQPGADPTSPPDAGAADTDAGTPDAPTTSGDEPGSGGTESPDEPGIAVGPVLGRPGRDVPSDPEPRPAVPSPAAPRRSTRGQLVLAVVLCTLGAALALYASSKSWAVDVTHRPAPLPPVRTPRTGADFVPVVPALALISLAGAGALVATRRTGRLLVGVLLVLTGFGVAAGAGYGLSVASRDPGATSPAWAVLALVGGLLVAVVGFLAVRGGRTWPTMGARYERPGAARPVGAEDDPAKVWDALDAGDDPTSR
ncbi:MAG TPA: Trp biosynthesis-associated membrane protein [Actinocatenispora sp.]